LALYYKLNFQLIQQHQYSLEVLENMIAWEREIYVSLLHEHIKQENEKIEKAQINHNVR